MKPFSKSRLFNHFLRANILSAFGFMSFVFLFCSCNNECVNGTDNRELKILVYIAGENATDVYNEDSFSVSEKLPINFNIPPLIDFQEDKIVAKFAMSCESKETEKDYIIDVNGEEVETINVTIEKTSTNCDCGENTGIITNLTVEGNSTVSLSTEENCLTIYL